MNRIILQARLENDKINKINLQVLLNLLKKNFLQTKLSTKPIVKIHAEKYKVAYCFS